MIQKANQMARDSQGQSAETVRNTNTSVDDGLTKKKALILELVRGVNDTELQQELVRKSGKTELEGLEKIAKIWQGTQSECEAKGHAK